MIHRIGKIYFSILRLLQRQCDMNGKWWQKISQAGKYQLNFKTSPAGIFYRPANCEIFK